MGVPSLYFTDHNLWINQNFLSILYQIYSSIQQSERILAVTQEQLHYHSTSTLAEANRVVARWCKQNFVIPANFDR